MTLIKIKKTFNSQLRNQYFLILKKKKKKKEINIFLKKKPLKSTFIVSSKMENK